MNRKKSVLVGLSTTAAAVAGVGVLGAPALAATPAPTPTTSPAPSAAAAACDAGPWGSRVQGTPPNFEAGDKGGDYLWHDATGFHLRVTHKGDDRVVYSGVITSPTPMRIDPVRLEKGDVAKLTADHRSLIFVFADYGHIDGVNFHTDCAPLLAVSSLNAGSSRLPANRVYLGVHEVHPAAVPFVIHRTDTA